MFNKILILFLIVSIITGCSSSGSNDSATIPQTSNVSVTGTSGIELKSTLIDLYQESSSSQSPNKKFAPKTKVNNFEYSISYVAQTKPVKVGTSNVHACDIKISGNKAFIAYNYAGDLFKGALQIIDITDKNNPQILNEIKFTDRDVNCLYPDGNKLLFGGAANPDVYNYRSFVGAVDLSNVDADNINASIVGYTESYGVTGITKKGNNYYAGVGAKDGGILTLDNSFTKISFLTAPDIRDIENYRNGIISLEGTTDNDNTTGKILIVDTDSSVKNEIDITNFNSNYAKSTIEVYNGQLAFLGLSSGGFKVFDITEKSLFFSAENPGEDSKYATNSISYDNNLIFSANGEYGFRVFTVGNINKKDSTFATVVGYVPFEELKDDDNNIYSANHIEFKSNFLFVASGVGGVNIYHLTKK